MLDTRTVLGKTDGGRDAIANRTHNLTPRQQALLISINGDTDVGGLLRRFGAGTPDAASAMLESLVDLGLVMVVAGGTESATAPTARAAPAAAPVATDPALPTDRPAPPASSAGGLRAAAAHSEATTWRAMQQRAGDSLQSVMGHEADLLAMRIMRSRSEAEFLSHMERAFELVRATRGESTALDFHHAVSGPT